MVNKSIFKLVDGHGGSLYAFYRALYKGIDCGPTIGFHVNNVWIYNDDLPDTQLDALESNPMFIVNAVSISSIVEGSDVEIPEVVFTEDFDPKDFWDAAERINKEAAFYWLRDNSDWYQVIAPSGIVHIVRNSQGDILWELGPEELPMKTRERIEERIAEIEESPLTQGKDEWSFECYIQHNRKMVCFSVSKYVNDSIF